MMNASKLKHSVTLNISNAFLVSSTHIIYIDCMRIILFFCYILYYI